MYMANPKYTLGEVLALGLVQGASDETLNEIGRGIGKTYSEVAHDADVKGAGRSARGTRRRGMGRAPRMHASIASRGPA